MDEKTVERIKKLQALAERGVGGEKVTAEKMLQKMLEKNGIRSLDELQSEEYEYTLFPYKGKYEEKLLRQCIYKVLTAAGDRAYYRTKGKRQKLGIYCTRAQKIEIQMEFEFYRNAFYEELDIFIVAFISAQKIFPPDAPEDCSGNISERDMKILHMAGGIDKRTRRVMIDDKGRTTWGERGKESTAMQLDYNKEKFTKVKVCGIECDFSDMRIDRSTVPEGLYQYEVADDDESQGNPTRVKRGIMVNFWGTLISNIPLPIGNDGVLWLDDGDFVYQ